VTTLVMILVTTLVMTLVMTRAMTLMAFADRRRNVYESPR